MARYLSAAWFDEVARHQPEAVAPPTLVLRQVVTGGPDGEVRYRVLVSPSGVRLEPGDHVAGAAPDVTFSADWGTATAVASGRLSMQAALGAGRIRVGGDLALLSTHQGLMAGIDPVPADVRAATSWVADGE